MIRLRKPVNLLLILILLSSIDSWAQTACSQKLSEAQDSFNQGHFYGIPSILKDCIDAGFSNEQRIEAYKLLTIVYLYIDDPIGAENSYLELLKLDPEHKVDPAIDPVEIIYLNDKFTTTPFFTLQLLKFGINATKPFVINNYSVGNTNLDNENYEIGVGFTFGAGVDYNLSDYFSIGLELAFERRSYNWNNTIFDQDGQKYRENMIGLSIPVFLRISYPTKKWHPYVYGGYALKINLLSGFTNMGLDNNTFADDGSSSTQPVIVPDIPNANELRNTLNTAIVAGLGVKYRLNYEYLSFDIRMNAGLLNHQNVEQRYLLTNVEPNSLEEESSLGTTIAILLDDIRVNDLTFTVGYVKPLYKPRKKVRGLKGLRSVIKRN